MINNQEFSWFLSTFTQTGKYCYGDVVKHEIIKIPNTVIIDRYILKNVDTNVIPGLLYENYPAYRPNISTALFTDNTSIDNTWSVEITNYTDTTKPKATFSRVVQTW